MTWDALGRPNGQQVKDVGQATLLQRSLKYDSEDNPVKVETERGIHEYVYDQLNRLTNATHPSGLPTEGFTLDSVGNRLVDITKPNPAQSDGKWQYNANHQLLQAATENTSFMGSNSQPINYGWDAAGNLTQKSTPAGTEGQFPTDNQRYVYDAQNRLIETQDAQGNAIASYQYDPFGRRIRKTVYREWNSGWQALATPRTHTYLYLEEGLSAEYRHTGNQIPVIYASYGWMPESPWGTSPIWTRIQRSDTQETQRFSYHSDNVGTPLLLTDVQGAAVWRQQATAFGETQVDPASVVDNPLRFPGQYYDVETKTHYNYMRHYDPSIGRYTQTDPIGLRGGVNTYLYVGGNPVAYIDPEGKLFWIPVMVGGVLVLKAVFFLWDLYDVYDILSDACSSGEDKIGAIGLLAVGAVVPGASKLEKARRAGKVAKEIELSRKLHGEAAQHADDAIKAGKPDVLTIERPGAPANRQAATGSFDRVPGKQLDEYPPAMFKEGGAGASVRPINPRDNMSAGACIGNACRGLPDGTRVRIKVVD
jgi:RHS repeat-associated protein